MFLEFGSVDDATSPATACSKLLDAPRRRVSPRAQRPRGMCPSACRAFAKSRIPPEDACFVAELFEDAWSVDRPPFSVRFTTGSFQLVEQDPFELIARAIAKAGRQAPAPSRRSSGISDLDSSPRCRRASRLDEHSLLFHRRDHVRERKLDVVVRLPNHPTRRAYRAARRAPRAASVLLRGVGGCASTSRWLEESRSALRRPAATSSRPSARFRTHAHELLPLVGASGSRRYAARIGRYPTPCFEADAVGASKHVFTLLVSRTRPCAPPGLRHTGASPVFTSSQRVCFGRAGCDARIGT